MIESNVTLIVLIDVHREEIFFRNIGYFPCQSMGGNASSKPIVITNESEKVFRHIDPKTNKVADEYVSLKPLGQGGFGQVHHVKNRAGQEYALKYIPIDSENSAEFIVNEIQIHLKLNHENIPKFKTAFPIYNKSNIKAFCLIIEYIVGSNLRKNIRERTLLPIFTVSYFIKLLTVISYLHDQDITHRDIKPENIMADTGGSLGLKLVDFGISNAGSRKMRGIMGTLAYMAPEMFTSNYGMLVDEWAMGVVLFECLTGDSNFILKDKGMYDYMQEKKYVLNQIEFPSLKIICKSLLQEDPNRRIPAKTVLQSETILGWRVALDLTSSVRKNPLKSREFLAVATKTLKEVESFNPFQVIEKLLTSKDTKYYISRLLFGSKSLSRIIEFLSIDPLFWGELVQNFLEGSYFIGDVLIKKYGIEHIVGDFLLASKDPKVKAIGAKIMERLPYFSNPETIRKYYNYLRSSGKATNLFIRFIFHKHDLHLLEQDMITKMGNFCSTLDLKDYRNVFVITLTKLLYPNNHFVNIAQITGLCTRRRLGRLCPLQPMRRCDTCSVPRHEVNICLNCAKCHKGHKLSTIFFESADCGCLETCVLKNPQPKLQFSQVMSPMIPRVAEFQRNVQYWSASNRYRMKATKTDIYQYEKILYIQDRGFIISPTCDGNPNEIKCYFEARMIKLPKVTYPWPVAASVGYAPMKTEREAGFVGWHDHEVGYHADNGEIYYGDGGKSHTLNYGPTFCVNDVIGCGITAAGKFFFVHNGIFLGIIDNIDVPNTQMFACFAALGSAVVEFNYNPPFQLTIWQQNVIPVNFSALDMIIKLSVFEYLPSISNHDVISFLLWCLNQHNDNTAAAALYSRLIENPEVKIKLPKCSSLFKLV